MNPLPLVSDVDRRLARALVERCGLRFENDFEELVGVFDGPCLAACGARRGRVLKMIVVAPEYRGTGLAGEVVTELMRRGQEAGYQPFFVFCRPCAAEAFQHLGFRPLVRHEKAVLLEYGGGLHRWLRRRASLARSGRNAALIINSDPFYLGHQHLVEQAATLADTVYVMVPSDGPFSLPLRQRLELARKGTRHLPNVTVIEAGPYLLGYGTFPAYFLQPEEHLDRIQLEIDVDLFGQYVAPLFHIEMRIVGTEPLDPAGRAYNQTLRQRLDRWGVRLVEIERQPLGGQWISTGHVHNALARGDWRQLEAYVPPSTYTYLRALYAEG